MIDFCELASETLRTILKRDVDIIFDSKNNDFNYNRHRDVITLPIKFKIREINRHHIYWIKRYGLDLFQYTDTNELLIAYYIFCICHEVGHQIHSRIDRDEEYVNYIMYAESIAEDWDMYRSILTEQLADEYACSVFNAKKEEIDNLIRKYNF